MEKVSKKISIADDLNNGDNLEINKIGRPDTGLKERLKIDKEVKDFYQETIVSPLTSPRKSRSFGFGRFILRVLLSLIFGALGAIFILTRQSVYLPLVGEINLQKYFPAREVNLTTEKKVTVTQYVRMDELIKTIKPQFVRLFESKESANSKNLTFL